jgi:hypothetical protein
MREALAAPASRRGRHLPDDPQKRELGLLELALHQRLSATDRQAIAQGTTETLLHLLGVFPGMPAVVTLAMDVGTGWQALGVDEQTIDRSHRKAGVMP